MVSLLLLACAGSPALLGEAQLDEALAVAAEVDPQALDAAVRRMVEAHAADPGTPIADWEMTLKSRSGEAALLAAFAELSIPVSVETEEADGWESHNLVVELPGTERPDEIVLVTAHYDVWYVGADDNSSAVAVLLELGRVLSTRSMSRTVRLVAFDLEELGLLGSGRYYRAHQGEDIRAVWNMDAVGYASQAPGSQAAPTGFSLPDVGDFLAVIANDPAEQQALVAAQIAGALPTPLPVQGVVGDGDNRTPGTGSFHRSDHSAAWSLGLPAVFFTDTADLRNPNYHTETDLPDTLDPDFHASVARVVLGATYASAELLP